MYNFIQIDVDLIMMFRPRPHCRSLRLRQLGPASSVAVGRARDEARHGARHAELAEVVQELRGVPGAHGWNMETSGGKPGENLGKLDENHWPMLSVYGFTVLHGFLHCFFTWFYRKDGGLNIGICLKIVFASKTLGI